MGKGRTETCLYFDSSVYVAYYRNQTVEYGKNLIAAIAKTLEENKAGGGSIVTSSLTYCEVIPVVLRYKEQQTIDDFKNRFKFALHTAIDVDPEISEAATGYRDYYRERGVSSPKLFKNL